MEYNCKVTQYPGFSEFKLCKRPLSVPGTAFKCDDYGVISPKKRIDGYYETWQKVDCDFQEVDDLYCDCIGSEFVFRPYEYTDEELLKRREESQRVSLSRSKSNIFSLAMSVIWKWFGTFTFDSNKVNRYDYAEVSKKMSVFFNNLRRKCPGLKYLLVPEKHKDGAFHFHALLADCDGLNIKYSGKIRNGDMVYNLLDFELGFTALVPVKDTQRVASYITKYITKDLIAVTPHRKRYWASKNIKRPEPDYYLLEPSMRMAVMENAIEQGAYHSINELPMLKQRFDTFSFSEIVQLSDFI